MRYARLPLSEDTVLALQFEEQLIGRNKTKKYSEAGMSAFKKISDTEKPYDEFGLLLQFLYTLIDHNLPWVATKTLFECGNNVFAHAQQGAEVSVSMAWPCIREISQYLQQSGYYEQSADLLSYGASCWPILPDEAIELHLSAAAALVHAKYAEEGAREIASAAAIAVKIGEPRRAYLLYLDAANTLLSDNKPGIPEKAIRLLRRARGIANNEVDYSEASQILLAQKDWELRKLLHDLHGARGLYKLKVAGRIAAWWLLFLTSGHFERPLRVAASAAMVIFVFAVLYFPDMHLVKLQGIHDTNFCEKVIDSIHFSIVTFTTVGYGNIYPVNAAGKMLTSLEAILGVLFVGQFLFVLGRAVGPR